MPRQTESISVTYVTSIVTRVSVRNATDLSRQTFAGALNPDSLDSLEESQIEISVHGLDGNVLDPSVLTIDTDNLSTESPPCRDLCLLQASADVKSQPHRALCIFSEIS